MRTDDDDDSDAEELGPVNTFRLKEKDSEEALELFAPHEAYASRILDDVDAMMAENRRLQAEAVRQAGSTSLAHQFEQNPTGAFRTWNASGNPSNSSNSTDL